MRHRIHDCCTDVLRRGRLVLLFVLLAPVCALVLLYGACAHLLHPTRMLAVTYLTKEPPCRS